MVPIPSGAKRVAELYRRACEHLALARARNYPRYLLDRLDRMTADAHQVIYQRREFGLARVKRAITHDFPRAVRANASYVWTSAALLYLPMLLVGWLVYQRPDLILSVTAPRMLPGPKSRFRRRSSRSATRVARIPTGTRLAATFSATPASGFNASPAAFLPASAACFSWCSTE